MLIHNVHVCNNQTRVTFSQRLHVPVVQFICLVLVSLLTFDTCSTCSHIRTHIKKTPPAINFTYFGKKEIYCILRSATWSIYDLFSTNDIHFIILSSIIFKYYVFLVGRVAHSVQRLTTGWTVRWSNPGGARVSARPDRRLGPPSLL